LSTLHFLKILENSFEVLKILKNSFEVLNISVADWDAQIAGSRSLAVLRDRQIESSTTREYQSLIQTYFDTHTVNGIFLRDEERLLYEEMLRLQGLGTYTDDQIMAIVHRGNGSGSDGGGDDKSSDDEDADEEQEDEDEDS
ncbi:hypothetical protein Tco_0442942, partial [Tanacetum coccineum]